jgi:hypothetical protein
MIEEALSQGSTTRRIRDMTTRALGYGRIRKSRALAAADERATLVGTGWIGADEAHEYRIPLPPGIAGKKIWRRLTLTLGWMTPIDCNSRVYRRAALFFAPGTAELLVDRKEVDWQSVRRGTVQHEVFEGEKASAFADGADLMVVVNCKSDPSRLKASVPYALLASLEVSESVGIAVSDEVRTRLSARVSIVPAAGGVRGDN